MQTTLKCLSALLSYPSQGLQDAGEELTAVIGRARGLSPDSRAALVKLIRWIGETDLLDLQADYVRLFDQGRDLSLHLFEHVHGQSRDRGQAMVDLLARYRKHGFRVTAHELPDYLPLMLEFSAQLPAAEARQLLADAMGVIALLGARLAQRKAPVAAIFAALAELAGSPDALADKHDEVAGEGADETLVNMDKIWEEETVTFMSSAKTCQSAAPDRPDVLPVHWAPRRTAAQTPVPDSSANGSR